MKHTTTLMKTLTISDKLLRAQLISAATKLETLLKESRIDEMTPIQTTTPYGLKIDVFIEMREEKPDIFNFTYYMDEQTFLGWLQSMKYLLEGPLIFMAKGVEMFIPEGLRKHNKTAVKFKTSSIDGHESDRWIKLLEEPVTFRVYREVINRQEWEIFYDEK